ncbi:MAG TPA: pyruvate, water dikinase regulatory protein [Burkholderiaceae bacterium]|nr:pyruvate, water dikinase regulatory protein [Burkholderiaceae bacterium]
MTSQPQGSQFRDVFYVSDGTGITAETLGHSVLAQFDSLRVHAHRMSFVDTAAKAVDAVERINDSFRRHSRRPIVFSTLVDPSINAILHSANAFILDPFETFVVPLEQELGCKSTHTIGRFHNIADSHTYKNRIEAISYALAHDDGQSAAELQRAEVILIGVSRSGKTPTSLYLAMQYGVKSANYPLIPEDFERGTLPSALTHHRHKLFGLSIAPERLAEVRYERRPNSRYASLENCCYEVAEAERLMRVSGVRWLSTTTKSIEEIAATVLQDFLVERPAE